MDKITVTTTVTRVKNVSALSARTVFINLRSNLFVYLLMMCLVMSFNSYSQSVTMSFLPGGVDNCSNPLPNAGTYTASGTVNGKNSYFNGANLKIIWTGTQWELQANGGFGFSACWYNTNATTTPPMQCWQASFGCFPIELSGPDAVDLTPSISANPSNSAICAGNNTTFSVTASGTSLTYQWKVSTNGGTSFSNLSNTGVYSNVTTATMSITGATAGLDSYQYKCVVSGGCSLTATSTAATLTVNAPTVATTTPASRCDAGTVTLGATAGAGTLNWYAASSGGSSLGTGTSYITPSISSTTTYYVDATSGGCTSARTSVAATVNTTPTVSGTTPASRCDAGTVTLGATASAGTLNWYAASSGGSSLGTGTSYTTPGISSTTTYYVDATSGGCTSARTAVAATVNTTPAVSGTTPASRCDAGTVILGATTSAGTLNWYAASSGGSSLGTGTSYTTPSISSTTTYYVDATNSGCTSARTSVAATVNTTPAVSGTTPASRCDAGTVILGATASAGTLNWYSASSGGSSLGTGTSYTTPGISSTTTYYVDATNSGCTSVRTAVTATIKNSTVSDTTAFVYGSINWHGTVYNTSGDKTRIITNAAGCDSTITLHLTILTPAALNFDGTNDYVSLPIAEATTEITNEFWFKTTQATQGLFSITDVNPAPGGYDRDIYLVNGDLNAYVYEGPTEVITTSGTNYADGNWHHVAHVIGASVGGQKLYVDGILKASGSYSYSSFTWNTKIILGFSQVSPANNYFAGTMDEVRIWNVARTQAEIQNSMNCGIPGATTNLVASYHFDNGTPNANNAGAITLTDVSGNGKNGTLVNFALTGTSSNWVDDITTLNPVATAVITADNNTVCAGTTVTFTATPINGGATPSYQWKKNNVNVGTNSATYADAALTSSDEISCMLTSSIACASDTLSNTIKTNIKNATSSDTTAMVYNSFTWYGNTYTTSGDKTRVIANAAGCDSTITLHLTIFTPSALSFDGADDYVNCGTALNNGFNNANTITVEAWINTSTTDNLQTIVGNYGNNMQFLLRLDNMNPVFWVSDVNTGFANATGANSIPTNTWVHLAGTWDGSTIKIYVNGVLDGSSAYSGNFPAITNNLQIGRNIPNEIFHGNIDEIRIWNTTRTQTEIQNNMNCGIPNAASGLIANYHFDNGSPNANNAGSTTLTDVSGSGYNGTLNNFALTGTSSNWVDDVNTLNPVATATIVADNNAVCAGTNVTFTVSPINGGAAPAYQWMKNNQPVGAGGTTYADATLTSADEISCMITSSLTCANDTLSNKIKITVNNATTGDTTVTACDSFTWFGIPYTSSGTPTHVLTNAMGCDSTVTLHLTVNNSNTGDTTVTACDSFTWFGTSYTSSGTPTHVLTNAAGCDSTVTLHLTINNSNTGDTTVTACDSFTWFGTSYTSSGTPTHVLTNAMGCDSTVTLHLTINNSNTGDTTVTACNSFTWFGTSYTSSGTPTHVLTNAAGCDSVVTLHLTINNNTGDTTVIACDSFAWYGTSYSASGDQTHVLTNAAGCDSVVTLHLTINNSTMGDTTVTACDSFTWFGITYTSSGTPAHALTNAMGCDSTVTLHLTINTTITATFTQSGDSLTASANGTSYQWFNCSDSSAIAGEINQVFIPAMSGDYGVIVNNGACSDTSACQSIIITGIKSNSSNQTDGISVYPNPNNGLFMVSGNNVKTGSIKVFNALGEVVYQSNIIDDKSILDITTQAPGIYMLLVVTDKETTQHRIVKQ